MTDAVLPVTPGLGANVPDDDVTFAGVTAKFQFIKMMDGTAGSLNRLSINASGAILTSVVPSGATNTGGNGSQTAASTSTLIVPAPGPGLHLYIPIILVSNFSNSDVGVTFNDTLGTNFLAPHLQTVPVPVLPGLYLQWAANTSANFVLAGTIASPVVVNMLGWYI